MITFYGENSEEGYRLFRCNMVTTEHYRDRDRYSKCRVEVETIEEETMDRLYQRMAWSKAAGDVPAKDDPFEYTEVAFGDIYEVLSCEAFDMDRLTATPEWQKHIAKIEAARLAEEANKSALAAKRVADQEEDERKLYARLREKFG